MIWDPLVTVSHTIDSAIEKSNRSNVCPGFKIHRTLGSKPASPITSPLRVVTIASSADRSSFTIGDNLLSDFAASIAYPVAARSKLNEGITITSISESESSTSSLKIALRLTFRKAQTGCPDGGLTLFWKQG